MSDQQFKIGRLRRVEGEFLRLDCPAEQIIQYFSLVLMLTHVVHLTSVRADAYPVRRLYDAPIPPAVPCCSLARKRPASRQSGQRVLSEKQCFRESRIFAIRPAVILRGDSQT